MRPRPRAAGGFPVICLTPRACLSLFLSAFCLAPLGPAPSLFAAPSAASPASLSENSAKNKKAVDPSLKGLPITELTADEAILHALNRLAYGPRPGDVERIKQMGLAKWIEQQLNPNSIDDRAVEARLQNFPTLRMSSAKLIEEYPRPKQAVKQEQKAERAGRRSDQAAAVIARDWNRPPSAQNMPPETETNAPPPSSAPAEKNDAATAAGSANAATRGAGAKRDLSGGDPNAVPRAIADDSRRPQRIVEELAMAKMTRAIYSERQLQQVMDDFWFNHFN